MQSRHRHFIRPCVKVEYPTCIVAVAAADKDTGQDSAGRGSADSLSGWKSATATLTQGLVKKHWACRGEISGQFWDCLDQSLTYHRDVLIVSVPAWHTMKLLGIEEELTEQRCYLVRSDPLALGLSSVQRGIRPAGYMVLENPPTIIRFKRAKCSGTATWIDMRNYGLCECLDGQETSTLPRRLITNILAIIGFIRERNLGGLKATVASQALSSWKYRFLKHSIHVSTNEQQNKLAQDSLYGGRCECYRIGRVDGPIAQFDFNSLYPSVYAKRSVPVRCQEIKSYPSQSYIDRAMREGNCIARVLVDTATPNVPRRDDRGTYFPIGRFATTVCFPELELVYATARRVVITEIATFDLEPALSAFAYALYAERTKAKSVANVSLAQYIKALLVSLPGKFGQRNKRWRISANQTCSEPWSEWYRRDKSGSLIRCRSIGWTVEEEEEAGLAGEAVPEIAAWVNSWGRRILWEAMCHAGRDQVCYCDTDSVWTVGEATTCILDALPQDSNGLGELRRVGEYQQVEFRGIKHYVADGKLTCAGLPKRLRIQRGKGLVEQSSTQSAGYDHGTIRGDGTVDPIVIGEW